MRYTGLLILFLTVQLFSIRASGQVLISLVFGDKLNTGNIEFGLDGGMNFANFSGESRQDNLRTYNLGFYFDIKTGKEKLLFHTGVLVKSTMGGSGLDVYPLNNADLDAVFEGGSIERRVSNFHVPIALKYYLGGHIFVEAGPQLGLTYRIKDIFINEIEGEEVRFTRDLKGTFHPLEAGVMAGVGYRLSKGYGMNLTVRYYQGLTDIIIDDSTPDVRNQVLYLNVGIPIGVKKARERAEKKNESTE